VPSLPPSPTLRYIALWTYNTTTPSAYSKLLISTSFCTFKCTQWPSTVQQSSQLFKKCSIFQ
jgi:hypothetical protein